MIRLRRALLVSALSAVACLATASIASADATPECSVSGGTFQPCTPLGSWYTAPVTVKWILDSNDTPTSGCGSFPYSSDILQDPLDYCSYSYPPNGFGSAAYPINVEVSTPTATTSASTPANANGWYNRPVTISFVPVSSFSGFSATACSAPVTYSGPDTASTTITGTCTDAAGKTAIASATFGFDSAQPALSLSAEPGNGVVGLNWSTSDVAPVASVTVSRTSKKGAPLYQLLSGQATSFVDSAVSNGEAYDYTVTVTDQAGNVSSASVEATPKASTVTPGIALLPILRWKRVPKATYYNVQIFRGKKKVLSAWPTSTDYKVKASWRYDGHSYRLTAGTYHWYVWPGYGRRARARYGKLIRSTTFAIARGSL